MIDAILMITLGLLMLLVTYKLKKKINGNPCVKFRKLLEHKDFKSILLLFIVTFAAITIQYILLALGGVTFSTVLCITNNSLLIICFFYMQHLIPENNK